MTKEELEKEAEKHADGIYHYKINVSDYGEDGIINYRYSDVKEAYQKGAEFGYNKANEWHYVKDGDYPKDESKVLCVISELEDSYCEIGYYSQVKTQTHRWIFEDYVMKDKSKEEWGVIAWKEIVLPKESE